MEVNEANLLIPVVSIVGSFVAAMLGAWISFRLQVARFFGKDEAREKHQDERHREVMDRLAIIEGTIRARRASDR